MTPKSIIELKNTISNFQNNTYVPVFETQSNTGEKSTSSNTSTNLSAADLSSHTQRPPDVNGFITKFKQSLTEDQRNMFNTFNTLVQANSMQERNSARNDDVQ